MFRECTNRVTLRTLSKMQSSLQALWVCLLVVCSVPVLALDRDRSIAQFHHTTWSVSDGGPGEISALAQTSGGYLWIGSPRGLFRFDCVKSAGHKPPPG